MSLTLITSSISISLEDVEVNETRECMNLWAITSRKSKGLIKELNSIIIIFNLLVTGIKDSG